MTYLSIIYLCLNKYYYYYSSGYLNVLLFVQILNEKPNKQNNTEMNE